MKKAIRHGFYLPTSRENQYSEAIDIKVMTKQQEITHFKYRRIAEPLYWNIRDFVDDEKRNQILRSYSAPQIVCLGIPSCNGEKRIYTVGVHLEAELRKVEEKHPDWSVNLVVASNGSTDNTEGEVKRLQSDFIASPVGITLISMPIPSKVDAINIVHLHARHMNATILAIADDDVHYSPSAVLLNIEALLNSQELSIVGSVYKPVPGKDFWGEIVSIASRRRKIQTILNGRMMIFHAETYPMIPSYIISDDFYLTAYFIDMEADHPLRRIIINDATSVTYEPPSGFRQLKRRYERVLLGWEQILRFSPPNVEGFLREVLEQSTWLANLKEPWYDDENFHNMFFNLVFSVFIRTLRLKVFIELQFRQLLGIPKKIVVWSAHPRIIDQKHSN